VAKLVHALVLGTSELSHESSSLSRGTMEKTTINKNNSGGRLDKFLMREFFLDMEISRGEIIRNIKSGKILVNDKIVKPSYLLKESDQIEINIPEKKERLKPNKDIDLKIIFEDENIIVVDKPAGLQVHPGFKNEENTLVNGLLDKFPEIKNIGEDLSRPGIVHRLDKDTSGVMAVARNQKSFDELKNKFKNREVSKKYLALAQGHINPKTGIIEKPIARSSDYRKQTIAGRKTKTKIRPAITEYNVLKSYLNFDLVEVSPKTGRTHQIRVHLTSIGHPIVGDKKYRLKNTPKLNEAGRPACNACAGIAGRQMLHAKSLEFELLGKKYAFQSKVPKDFAYLTKVR
jgi:23S rRNA pseudouridine1911/1915/1917 synthase